MGREKNLGDVGKMGFVCLRTSEFVLYRPYSFHLVHLYGENGINDLSKPRNKGTIDDWVFESRVNQQEETTEDRDTL